MHRIIRESLIVSGLCLSVLVEAADQAGTTALHVAACQCDLAAMKAARASGADINGLDIDGNTPLHFAAGVRGEMSGSPLCVNRASVVNVVDRCRAAIRYLVTSGGDVNKSNRFGEVPLHFAAQNPWAASQGTALLVQDLLQFGADPNVANNEGNTPLHVANLYAHNRDVISTLIRHRAKVDLANEKGITPLMRAVRHGPDRATAADLILYEGADPDRKNPRGDAPLHMAIKYGGNVGKGTVVSALLAANADPCVRDAQGYTPYQLSKGAIRQALSEAGGYDRSSPSGPGCPLAGEVAEEDQRARDIAARREAQRIAREEADRVDKENAAAQQQREDDADNLSDRDYKFIMGVRPIYPRRAQTRGIEGHVIVEYVVTATGAVRNPAVVEAEPPGIFDRPAIESVLKYKFRPRVVDGEAVDATGVRTRVVFELEDVEEEQAESAEASAMDKRESGPFGLMVIMADPAKTSVSGIYRLDGWPEDPDGYCRRLRPGGRTVCSILLYSHIAVPPGVSVWPYPEGVSSSGEFHQGKYKVTFSRGRCVGMVTYFRPVGRRNYHPWITTGVSEKDVRRRAAGQKYDRYEVSHLDCLPE